VELVQRVGDEVLIAAQEVAQAVQMALELRDALEQEPLFPTIRAGLHVGTVVEDGEHYVGSALNLTARVAAYARGGQVLCTEPVALRSAGISEVTCQPLGPVRAAYRLAVKQKRIKPHMVSYFPMPTFSNARKGFFEPEDFEAFVQHLPADYADPARFAYATGWRKGEIVSLTWEQIDHAAREVRLYDSKNGEGRTLALDGDAWTIIERRWQARVYTDRRTKQTHVSPLVFHTKGRPIGDIRKAWNAALEAAGLSRGSKLFHDLRRSGVRDMIRAGVLQSVAMSISGHKTVSTFLRYNITDGKDQRDALRRTAALRRERLATAHQTPTVTPLRTVHA
jgi:integrase